MAFPIHNLALGDDILALTVNPPLLWRPFPTPISPILLVDLMIEFIVNLAFGANYLAFGRGFLAIGDNNMAFPIHNLALGDDILALALNPPFY